MSLAAPATAQTPLFNAEIDSRETLEQLAGAFSCPFDKLVNLYSSLTPDELPTVLAIESEVLLICAQRQQRLLAILEAELALRELMELPPPGPGTARISITEHGLVGQTQIVAACPAPAPEPAAAQRADPGSSAAAPDNPVVLQLPPPAPIANAPAPPGSRQRAAILLAEALVALADRATGTPLAGQSCASWSWVWTVRDVQGRAVAGLRDPSGGALEVREQDRLPGGLVVSGITADGVFVADAVGRQSELPRMTASGHENDQEPEEASPPPPAELPPEVAELLRQATGG